ncbi:MAG: BTAD domain-containing putative transcriptional regulator [Deferrisomatales bacterium]
MAKRQGVPAKIVRPQVQGILLRERLFALLDEGRGRPLTWVSAPAGFGKTTLVSSYVEVRGLPCVWYRVDPGDEDLASFFYYLGLAGHGAGSPRRKPLPLLTPEYSLGIPAFSRSFFEELFRRLGEGTVLVLDNCHEIGSRAPLHAALLAGIGRMPEGARIVLTSRGDPPPAYARLRVHGRMDVVGRDLLRLTPEELEAFAGMRGVEVPPNELLRIHDLVQGWAAGIRVLLEAVRARNGSLHLLGEAAPEELLEYLGAAVFERLGHDAQDFLVKTSVLPDMTVSVAEELTGRPQAGKILSALHRNGDFTEKGAEPEPVYQYHPLFREFLRKRATETWSEGEIAEVQRRAAELLLREGRPEEAAALLSDARDWDGLAGLILAEGQTLLQQGRHQTVEGWLRLLPEHHRQGNPWLLVLLGAATLPSAPPEAQAHFERAFALFREQGEGGAGLLLSWAGVVHAIFFAFADFHEADRWLELLPELIPSPRDLPPGDVSAQVASAALTLMAVHSPDHPDLPIWEEQALALEPTTGDPGCRTNLLVHALFRNIHCGRPAAAEAVLDRLRSLLRSGPVTPLAETIALHTEAAFCLLYGELESARAACCRAIEIGEETGIHLAELQVLLTLVEAELAAGRLDAARRCGDRMRELLTRALPWDRSAYGFVKARLGLSEGHVERAFYDVDEALAVSRSVGGVVSEVPTLLLRGEIYSRMGRRREAFRDLADALRIARRGKMRHGEFSCLLVAVWLHVEAGHPGRAVNVLRKAMGLGCAIEARRPFGFHGAPFAALCARALEAGIEPDYVRSLIRQDRLDPPQDLPALAAWPWFVRIYTLGRFEVLVDDEPIGAQVKGQRRPLALLKALIALGGGRVSTARLSDALWPDADGDAARDALTTTLLRLRRLLGAKDVLVLREGRLSLDRRRCWVDAWAMERLFREAGRTGERDPGLESPEAQAVRLYQGSFLPEDIDEPWAIPLRERLERVFLRGVEAVGARLEERGRWAEAARCYERALEVAPLIERLCRHLMVCCQKLERPSEALAAFERCRRLLGASLGVDPSPKTSALAESIRKGG